VPFEIPFLEKGDGTDAATKIVKNETHCAYNGLPWGASAP